MGTGGLAGVGCAIHLILWCIYLISPVLSGHDDSVYGRLKGRVPPTEKVTRDA